MTPAAHLPCQRMVSNVLVLNLSMAVIDYFFGLDLFTIATYPYLAPPICRLVSLITRETPFPAIRGCSDSTNCDK